MRRLLLIGAMVFSVGCALLFDRFATFEVFVINALDEATIPIFNGEPAPTSVAPQSSRKFELELRTLGGRTVTGVGRQAELSVAVFALESGLMSESQTLSVTQAGPNEFRVTRDLFPPLEGLRFAEFEINPANRHDVAVLVFYNSKPQPPALEPNSTRSDVVLLPVATGSTLGREFANVTVTAKEDTVGGRLSRPKLLFVERTRPQTVVIESFDF